MRFAFFSMDTKAGRNRGSVLLLTLGILALLSLLGVSLIFISRHESLASRDFLDQTRAQLAAESGVDHALAKIGEVDSNILEMTQAIKTFPNKATTPLKHITQSSFGTLDSDNDGQNDIAGAVSGTYIENGDRFKLRVESCQSKLNINDSNSALNIDTDPYEDQMTPERNYLDVPAHLRTPSIPEDFSKDQDPDWIYPGDDDYVEASAQVPGKPYPRAEGRLRRIFKELVDVLFNTDPGANPTPGEKAADALFKARKATGHDRFNSFNDVKAALVPSVLKEPEYALLETFLTLDSWRDEHVLRPTFQWRISTPSWTDPNDPRTAHINQFAGDWPTPAIFNFVSQLPPARAGMDFVRDPEYPEYITEIIDRRNIRGVEFEGRVEFDYNNNGTVEAPDPNNPLAYNEHFSFTKDIYMFSDMQTRFFATESRAPVDVNGARVELLEALIAPVRTWYLKEEPDLRRGEDPKSRVEDWSQCTPHLRPFSTPGHPWLSGAQAGVWDLTAPALNMGMTYTNLGFETADEVQYYYYDSFARVAQFSSKWRIAGKCARMGELEQSFPLTLKTKATGESIAKVLARAIHSRIHPDADKNGVPDSFNPFQTWEELEFFLLDLADADGFNDLTTEPSDFDIPMAQALIANFNPNSRLNDFNQNKRLHMLADKSQLTGYSTELCFHTCGYFKIESLGEVLKPDGRASDWEILASVKTHEAFRVTTQAQFMRGFDNTNLLCARNYFSESASPTPTFGAQSGYAGDSLQSYPEPECLEGNWIAQSRFDGHLALATLQPSVNELFQEDPAGGAANNIFLANFHGTLNAAKCAVGKGQIQSDPTPEFWTFDPWKSRKWICGSSSNTFLGNVAEPNAKIPSNHPGARALTRPLPGAKESWDSYMTPGNLFPDGALSDVGRGLKYRADNNIGESGADAAGRPSEGKIGSVQFWVKPNFSASHTNRPRCFFATPPRLDPLPVYYTERQGGHGPDARGHYGADTNGDPVKSFHLYYFGRGGYRAAKDPANGRLDDDIFFSYEADWLIHRGRWIPTRSFFLVAGEHWLAYEPWHSIHGISTTSANQSWREAADPMTPGLREMNFESHAWTHVAFGWDWIGRHVGTPNGVLGGAWNLPDRYCYLVINGQPVERLREEFPAAAPNMDPNTVAHSYFGVAGYRLKEGIHQSQYENPKMPNYMRFGESSSAPWRNHVADATFDDIASNRRQKDDDDLGWEYRYGRYGADGNPTYTSPEFDITNLLNSQTQTLSLCSIGWTAYWPLPEDNAKTADQIRFNEQRDMNNADFYRALRAGEKKDSVYPMDPMCAGKGGIWDGDWAPFSIDIQNPDSGKWRYSDEAGLSPFDMPNFAGASQDPEWMKKPLRWKKGNAEKFRFRVHFNVEEGQTLYATPVFDDITFIFRLGNPLILSWENSL